MIGDLLRAERERQNLSIKDIEKATSIRALYIDAIEKCDYKTLPGEAYAKGFVRNYANYLKLDANAIVNGFNEELHPQEEVVEETAPSSAEDVRRTQASERSAEEYRGPKITSLESYPMEKSSHGTRNALLVAVAVFVVAFAALIAFGGDEETPAPAPAPRSGAQTAQHGQKQTEAAQKPASDGVEMQLKFTDRCWTEVVVDGKTEFEGTAEKGKVLNVKGKDKVHITAGNAGALTVSLNGKDMGTIGQKGEVVEKTFTKDAAASQR